MSEHKDIAIIGIQKRRRVRSGEINSHACQECRIKHRKCTGETPCKTCKIYNVSCIYKEREKREKRASPKNTNNNNNPSPLVPAATEFKLGVSSDFSMYLNAYLKFFSPFSGLLPMFHELAAFHEEGREPAAAAFTYTVLALGARSLGQANVANQLVTFSRRYLVDIFDESDPCIIATHSLQSLHAALSGNFDRSTNLLALANNMVENLRMRRGTISAYGLLADAMYHQIQMRKLVAEFRDIPAEKKAQLVTIRLNEIEQTLSNSGFYNDFIHVITFGRVLFELHTKASLELITLLQRAERNLLSRTRDSEWLVAHALTLAIQSLVYNRLQMHEVSFLCAEKALGLLQQVRDQMYMGTLASLFFIVQIFAENGRHDKVQEASEMIYYVGKTYPIISMAFEELKNPPSVRLPTSPLNFFGFVVTAPEKFVPRSTPSPPLPHLSEQFYQVNLPSNQHPFPQHHQTQNQYQFNSQALELLALQSDDQDQNSCSSSSPDFPEIEHFNEEEEEEEAEHLLQTTRELFQDNSFYALESAMLPPPPLPPPPQIQNQTHRHFKAENCEILEFGGNSRTIDQWVNNSYRKS